MHKPIPFAFGPLSRSGRLGGRDYPVDLSTFFYFCLLRFNTDVGARKSLLIDTVLTGF